VEREPGETVTDGTQELQRGAEGKERAAFWPSRAMVLVI